MIVSRKASMVVFSRVNAVGLSVGRLRNAYGPNQKAEAPQKKKTRANTGHAVLISTPRSPKMKRRNGRTDGRTDRRTDGRTDPLIEVLIST